MSNTSSKATWVQIFSLWFLPDHLRGNRQLSISAPLTCLYHHPPQKKNKNLKNKGHSSKNYLGGLDLLLFCGVVKGFMIFLGDGGPKTYWHSIPDNLYGKALTNIITLIILYLQQKSFLKTPWPTNTNSLLTWIFWDEVLGQEGVSSGEVFYGPL